MQVPPCFPPPAPNLPTCAQLLRVGSLDIFGEKGKSLGIKVRLFVLRQLDALLRWEPSSFPLLCFFSYNSITGFTSQYHPSDHSVSSEMPMSQISYVSDQLPWIWFWLSKFSATASCTLWVSPTVRTKLQSSQDKPRLFVCV